MKGYIPTMALALTLAFGSTVAKADGIIINERGVAGDGEPCKEASIDLGSVVKALVGIIINERTGIIINERSSAAPCGIIINERNGIIINE